MNILGLDLSITAAGICPPDGRPCTIKGPSKLGDRRLVTIADKVRDVHIATPITLAVIEGLYGDARGGTITAMAHGAVIVELIRLSVPYVMVPPATLKAFATGKGGASKSDMAVAALKRAGVEFGDDNQCDAWWLRQAGLHHYGLPEFDLPAMQRGRLDKVAWPQLGRVLL